MIKHIDIFAWTQFKRKFSINSNVGCILGRRIESTRECHQKMQLKWLKVCELWQTGKSAKNTFERSPDYMLRSFFLSISWNVRLIVKPRTIWSSNGVSFLSSISHFFHRSHYAANKVHQVITILEKKNHPTTKTTQSIRAFLMGNLLCYTWKLVIDTDQLPAMLIVVVHSR